MIDIRPVPADQTYPLRNLVLRPGQPVSACQWPGDEEPDSFHLGAFVDEMLRAIASVIRQEMPGDDRTSGSAARSFRLRGMATHPDYRGQGLGTALLHECISRVRPADGEVLWCNARSRAADFYRRAGFETLGEEFVLPDIGPHLRMQLRLTGSPFPTPNT